MGLDTFIYRHSYRHGTPPWDRDEPYPELTALIADRSPGRALDLGCGTGATVIYLARHGWDAVGVDFSPEAIDAATARNQATGAEARFIVGDVTRLPQAGVDGLFDLVIDIGCYHAIPARRRDAYADGVANITSGGADFYLAGVSRPPLSWRFLGATAMNAAELTRRFSPAFTFADQHTIGTIGKLGPFTLHHLTRTRDR